MKDTEFNEVTFHKILQNRKDQTWLYTHFYIYRKIFMI